MSKNILTSHGKGWRPDLPDARDKVYHATNIFRREANKPLPMIVDLRSSGHLPPVEDQGQLGSCTAFGTLVAFNYMHHVETGQFLQASRLFQYYNSRLLEGTVNEDAGAEIRDAIKVTKKFGTIPEAELPYVIKNFKHKPTEKMYADGLLHQSLSYLRVVNDAKHGGLTHIQTSLAAGYPVVFGCTLYESFESAGVESTGLVPMPQSNEQVLGGHCQLIVGYNRDTAEFLVRNSWGTGWALGGYEYMPFEYLTNLNLADDFWTLRKIEL